MGDIELVIKIPEEIYQHYKRTWSKRRGSIPESCIAFGAPLPKGHGRLIDADRLENDIYHDKRKAFTKHQVWLKVSHHNPEAPTIIEADK